MIAPAPEAGQVIGPYDQGEIVLRITGAESVQRTDGILGRSHLQFDVLQGDLEVRMAGDGRLGRIVAVLPGRQAVGILEGILRGDHQVHPIKTGFLGEKTDDGLVPFVQRVEAAAINCNLHSGTKL